MENQPEPHGKRTLRTSVRGSVYGYVGRTRWVCFGERSDPNAHDRAEAWLSEETTP